MKTKFLDCTLRDGGYYTNWDFNPDIVENYIKYTNELLNNNNSLHKWLEKFTKHKKKDDLADSFLQGLWYLKSAKL